MERLYIYQNKTNGFIKKLWLLAAFLVFALQANAQFVGCGEFYNITIANQYDMNQFALNYPGCTQIPGNLRIETSNITDLSQLAQITSVAGGIYIGETNLTNLNGLQNITHVGHDVRIRNNPLLTDISGLSNLNSDFVAWMGYGLEISNNPLLSTCNLPNFCSYLLNSSNFRTILNNAGDCATDAAMVQLCTPVTVCPSGSITLTSQAAVNAFAANHPNCIQITGSVKIEGDDITDLTPLSNIVTITEGLTIRTKNLTSLNGLHNLQKIGKYLYIYETELLTTLNGLVALTEVKGEIIIRTNLALNDISALSNIDSSLIRTVPIAADSYGINIFGNPQLATCNIPNFCSYLSNPTNSRNISNNTGNCTNAILTYACLPEITTCPMTDLVFNSQADLDAYGQFYPDCMEIYYSVTISGAVTDLSPLHTIQAIRGNLTISGTSILTDLDDLSSLTAVYGTISIQNNIDLEDISGLSGIKKINNLNDGLTITNNPALTICEVPNICMYLVNLSNPRTIENNSGNCNNATIGNSCMPVLPTCPVSGLVFNTQAQVDAFGLYYPNCTVIPDSVIISGAAITDLSPLGNIQTIEGELSISGASGLNNLNDLSSLTSVLGLVSIRSNINLQDISGLSGIISFNGLTITDNPALTICEVPNICMYLVNPANTRNIENNSGNCNNATIGASCISVLPTCPVSNLSFNTQAQVDAYGLYYPNCTEISGSLSISGGTITDLSPLNTIQTINGHLNIVSTSFTNLNSLGNLTSVKNLAIRYNSQLQDISGLSNVLELSASNSTGLIIEYNPLLATCSIPSICAYTSNVNNPRTINNNAGGCANNGALGLACEALLPSCPESTSIGFTNQQQLNDFALNYPNCTNFPGHIYIYADLDLTPLQNLQTIGGNFGIMYNIHDLNGLNALTSIGGNLTIQDSNQLQSLNALENLSSIGGSLIIINIPSLVDLDPLESLTHIGTGIRLESNAALVDISALSQLNTMVPPNWEMLRIQNNPLLATCNVPYICSYLLNPDASSLIFGNAGDCVSRYSVVTACNSTSCATPSNLTASNITINQAEITWDNSDNFNKFTIEFGPSGFAIGTGTIVSGITANSYLVSGLQMGTVYDVYLKKECGYNDSTALMTTFNTVGYCIPSATNTSSVSEGSYIKNFTTTGAITNISNIDSGYSVNGYHNFSGNHSASHYPGQSINFEAVGGNGTGTRGLKIWIDWDSSIAFEEASELVFSSAALQSGTHSGNFQIPANTAPGNYRMRLFLQENTLPDDPCNTTAQATAYGELEDYTLTVLELSPCNLDTVTSTNIISDSATLNWTSPGSLFEMEWGLAGFTQGTGTQQNEIITTSYTLQGLTEQTTYDVYVRSICAYNQSSWVKHTFSTRSICPSGDLVLQTQAHVDDFGTNYPNCTAITGNAYINGNNSNINNLAPLNNIVSISGSFNLNKLPQLSSVNGFTSLTSIGGAIDIYDTNLTNLNGLVSLTTVGSSITIGQNTLLTNISGIKNINPSTISSLMIYNNTNLAICNYDFICDYISGSAYKYFASNATGCQSQEVIATACATCEAPTNIAHVPGASATYTVKWTSLGSSFDIEWGTEGFVQGTGTQQNGISTSQCSLPGLQELASYDIYIRRNCTDTQSVWVKYTFTTNKVCPDMNTSFYFYTQDDVDQFAYTYPDCTQILGHVGVYGSEITNLAALSNIQNILWGIDLIGTSLTSLNDLSSLTSIGGTYISNTYSAFFVISENPLLTDISILENIDTTNFIKIDIIDNTSLEFCNYPIICNFLGAEGKTVRARGNAQGCENILRLYHNCGYECPTASLEFNTQAEVDAFGTYFSECTHINGSLTIPDGVEDLTPLSNIESIEGGLSVEGSQLTHLNGLSSLTSIGGLSLGYNELLTDVSALENVTISPTGDLYVVNNPSLSVCNISSICNYLQQGEGYKQVQDNALGCQDLLALYTSCGITLECPPGDVTLMSQQAIADFAATYPNCTQIEGNLLIGYEGQTDITDLSPLSNLEIISEGFGIIGSQVTNLNGLSSLTSVGALILVNNPLLNNISALENTVINLEGNIYIENNPSLSVCSISSICTFMQQSQGYVNISNNAPGCENESAVIASCPLPVCPPGDISFSSQEEIDAFGTMYPNCTQINGYLEIGTFWQNGDLITDISPLSNIQTIQGGLTIYETSLTHLNALSNLTAVNGQWLGIDGNQLLEDLSGLSNVNLSNLNLIDMEYDGLFVIYNPLLSVCNIPNFCDYISNDPATHPRLIVSNAEGCETIDDIATACLAPFPCLAPVALTASPTMDTASISWSSLGTSFDIEWGFSEFTQGEGLGFQNNISELNYVITELSEETSYDVYVRRNCVDTSSASNWVKYTFSTVSVCPSGDLFLESQEEINAFGAMYPNCTQIAGILEIGSWDTGSGINDLSPLSNIQTIEGGLVIYQTSLTNLNGLSNLTVVDGELLVIEGNTLLEDISGLSNVTVNPLNMQNDGLYILYNTILSVCNIPAFCEYLADYYNPRMISDNDGDCMTSDDVVNKCFAGNCESYTIWNGYFWSNGTPDDTKRVIVRNDLTISSDMTACELLLQAGIVNVNTGAAFTVEGEIFNTQSAENFIVESDANLIQLGDVENIGAITVKRNSFPLYRQDYTLWSSPVAGQNLRNFSPATLFNRFSSYDTSLGENGDYVQEIVTTADMNTKTFIDAKGYLIRMPNNWPVFVSEATPGTAYPGVFKGIPNNGNIAIPLSFANSGLNLVGNPYPSNISIESLFDANQDIDRVLYFWRKRNDLPGSGYATYTTLGLTSLNTEINGVDMHNTIKPGQGFFVKAAGAASLHFDNQMRTSGQNGHFLRNGNTIEKHRFWLNLSMNNQVLGQTLIGYVSGATLGVDNGIDAAYFNDSALALTSLINDAEYIIQGRSLPFADSDVVPLGFKSDVAGNYTISLSNFDGLFAENQAIYLKDNAAGALHNLKIADYSFTSPTGVFNDRFEVQYSTALGTNNPVAANNAILIGVKNQNIQINAGVIIMEKVELIDITGRIIYTLEAINATSVLLENIMSSNQVLIVRISTKENGTVTRKIIF